MDLDFPIVCPEGRAPVIARTLGMSPRVASPPSRLIHDGWILTKFEAVTDDSDLAGLAGHSPPCEPRARRDSPVPSPGPAMISLKTERLGFQFDVPPSYPRAADTP